MKIRNLLIYYLVIFAPLFILSALAKAGNITSNWFVFFLVIYVFPYRMITDYFRLRSKNVIARGEYRKLISLFYTSRYARELYFS